MLGNLDGPFDSGVSWPITFRHNSARTVIYAPHPLRKLLATRSRRAVACRHAATADPEINQELERNSCLSEWEQVSNLGISCRTGLSNSDRPVGVGSRWGHVPCTATVRRAAPGQFGTDPGWKRPRTPDGYRPRFGPSRLAAALSHLPRNQPAVRCESRDRWRDTHWQNEKRRSVSS